MAKRRELEVTLISSGTIKPELHYGPFSRNWWFVPSMKKNNDLEMMYPIRIGMKTQIELNGKNFIMRILKGNNYQPGYTCQCDSNSKVTLISSGTIKPELHYGPFSRNWWFVPSMKKNNDLEMMYPIRIGMKTQIELNGKNFIMRILKGNNYQPGYTCQCDSNSSEIEDNPTNAITSIYRQIFKTQTKISGSIVMGFDKESIISELLYNIEFHPYSISIESKLSIMVFGLDISKNEGWMGAGEGYMASFIYIFKKERCLFVQKFAKNKSIVEIWNNNIKISDFEGDSPVNVWQKIGILEKFRGTQLFGLEHTYTQSILQQLSIPRCQPSQWNDEEIMNGLYEYHFKRRTIANVNWLQLFKEWESWGNIFEINTVLVRLYPKNHKFSNQKMQAWNSMLKAAGCTNITPFNNDISMYKFWTRSSNPEIDKETLSNLYNSGFLNPYPSNIRNPVKIFWESFKDSLVINKKGSNGIRRILSIIAHKFGYEELQDKLGVSPTTINMARKYATLNGPGGQQIDKPKIIRNPPLSKEIENQFQAFFSDKSNVTMSSYKVDPKTNQPILYLLDQKESLWKRFSEIYPNGMKRTTFMTRIEDGPYRYQYGYEIFDNLAKIIKLHVENNLVQNKLLQDVEQIRRHIKREYVRELKVKNNGHIEHDKCIDHCLPFAFGECTETHIIRCNQCSKLYLFFDELESIIKEKQLLENKKEKLFHYLAHQARKTYLNAQVRANLLKLDSDGAILIVDYKMRILSKSARETKSEFFGKKEWTLHSILIYTKQESDEKLNIVAFDHWSTDTKQDAWFTASSLHAVFDTMSNKPKWIILISDNGPHYHNSEMMLIMAHWKDWYDIEVRGWIFLEAGEAKTAIDSHHAQIAHSIKRYVRIGFEIKEGNDIENAIKDLCDTNSKRKKIDTSSNKILMQNNEGNINIEENFIIDTEFQLASGWALKANQKFGKRGGSFFHAGNANKSDRYTAHDMLSELNDMAIEGELDPEIIPKVETIENWIGRYSAACKREMAAIVLERQEKNK
ncbi:hypothetical protein Glove_16g30 [Diversispora epigaea]|uniref:Uncharacterized protein n=1 Tax=Diversispora epigaea TaxID=1348612 RepID=A0A397JTC7_9GLOM|nr:hypothetical protein Glove_16g30 [Diversispora epigaea]